MLLHVLCEYNEDNESDAETQALGEMAAFLPHQKGFPGHASRFVGPSFGAMVGWAYWLKVSHSSFICARA
jgi:amino acid transporter